MSNGPAVAGTGVVVTLNVADVAPAGTVTVGGTLAAGFWLASVTTAPFAGARPVRVMVPLDVNPPRTLVGLKVTPWAVAARTVSGALSVAPP